MVWYGMARCGKVWYCMVKHGMLWYGAIWNNFCYLVLHGMVSYRMVKCSMVQYSIV